MHKRILESLSLSTILFGVNTFGQILAVPILLSGWGEQVYGEWLALTNVTASLSVLNFGVQSYILNILIGHQVRGEIEQGTRALHASVRLYALLGSLIIIITVIISFLPDLTKSLNIVSTSEIDARVIVFVQGIFTAYTIFSGLLMTLLIVNNQQPRRLRYSLITRIVVLGIPTVVALLRQTPAVAALWSTLLLGFVGIVQIQDTRRNSRFLIGFSQSTWHDSISLLRPSFAFFAVTVAGTLLTSGMTIAISTFIGAAAVALFNTTLMLTNFVRIFLNQGLNILWPEITRIAVSPEQKEQLIIWHRFMLKIVTLFGLFTSAGLIIFGDAILSLWTQSELIPDTSLNFLLAVYLLLELPTIVDVVFGLATNHQNETLGVSILTSLLSITVAVLLLPQVGIQGAGLGLIAGQFLKLLWIIRLGSQWTSDRYSLLLRAWLGDSWLTIGAIIIGVFICVQLADPFFQIFGLALIIGMSFSIGWSSWLTKTERTFIRKSIALFSLSTKLPLLKGVTKSKSISDE